MLRAVIFPFLLCVSITPLVAYASPNKMVHDAEYYILEAQNGERWAAEDKELDTKLAALEKKFGQPPNIVYILWDDQQVGAVGNPMIQKNLGYTTPNLNKMAAEGINFTRMYSEPSCTPTRVAFLTGRLPVRNGMGVVGMPHEFGGLSAEEKLPLPKYSPKRAMQQRISARVISAILKKATCITRDLTRHCLRR